MIEDELRTVLTRDALRRALSVRGFNERKDALNGVLRDAFSRSSLCYVDGALSQYDGRGYRAVSVAEVRDAVVNILSDCGVGASDIGKMGDTAYSVIRRKQRTTDWGKVAFRNAVIEIESGRVLPFSDDTVCGVVLDYDLDGGLCPMWDSFLCEVLPDAGQRAVLQEFFGMCLADRNSVSIEKMALFVGSGANGKSVVCDVIAGVLGSGRYVGNLSPDQLQDMRQVSSLKGKVLNVAPDVRKGAAFDSALKALASGQEVTGWKLYEGGVTIKCPPLAFALNEMPYFRDTTDAFFRRLLVFKFDVTIPEHRQNKRLASQILANERSGVFRWIAEGRRRLVANGGMFTQSDVMDAALAELKVDVKTSQSPVLQALESVGYALSGQTSVRVMANDLARSLAGGVTQYQMTKELKKAGVYIGRSRGGVYYQLYKI